MTLTRAKIFVGLLAVGGASCSLYVNAELENNLVACSEDPTTLEQSCADGYSLFTDCLCIPQRSVAEGGGCTASEQCAESDGGDARICSQKLFKGDPDGLVCAPECDTPFAESPSVCGANALCAPSEVNEGEFACYAFDCEEDADCNGDAEAPKVCVKGGGEMGVCWRGCSVTVVGDSYLDTCPESAAGDFEYFCTPPTVDSEALVCLRTGPDAQNQGAVCTLGDREAACAKGLACLRPDESTPDGVCAQYCDDETSCGLGTTCQAISTSLDERACQ